MSDRAAGVLLGQACGDALGVPYEFGPALAADFQPQMVGGGPFGFAPGEWSDDTAMAVCIAQVAATGADLTTDSALDDIAERFLAWGRTARDVGNQTRAVFEATDTPRGLRDAARRYAREHERSAGNGALMRTSVVGLTCLDDRVATAETAAAIASLTHADVLAIESCVLWSEAVRVAVIQGRFDLLAGLDLLSLDRRDRWRRWINEATDVDPRTFMAGNGFTVTALQAAWAAITWTPTPTDAPVLHFQRAVENAVRTGNDTDTVAAIAGGLLGALWGQSAMPQKWVRKVHGYPDCRAPDLVALAMLVASGGTVDERGWPLADRVDYRGLSVPLNVAHPHDSGVRLGSIASLASHGCDAVVSLCRVGPGDRRDAAVAAGGHIEVRLIDSEDPVANPNLDYVLRDTARTVRSLRDEGKTVFVHCVRAEQRTPAVALAYSRHLGVETIRAEAEVKRSLSTATGLGLLWGRAKLVRR